VGLGRQRREEEMLVRPGQFLGESGQRRGMNLAGWCFSDHL